MSKHHCNVKKHLVKGKVNKQICGIDEMHVFLVQWEVATCVNHKCQSFSLCHLSSCHHLVASVQITHWSLTPSQQTMTAHSLMAQSNTATSVMTTMNDFTPIVCCVKECFCPLHSISDLGLANCGFITFTTFLQQFHNIMTFFCNITTFFQCCKML